ncbi:Predicted ABC-type ATPase [Amycolatopsis xylanica]|uniref:Predicted ABC-type ATPase n=1 Tax=Amycolatopsis xylanica TaxID=589385 RepID=A0A1H2VG74_9PSEU|nr:AAA family ATPase [Amycolatopsis xylanica]SDW67375.1 Predicted ABC-type ATPase [Amycolatopsis xylanica]
MPRLIHLNGPSGVGKSTIAQLYTDRHAGVLNLDTDQIVSLIGGWQDDFWTALRAGRVLAIAMAETHLRTGHDVVMPQLTTRLEEIEGFEAAAARGGAEYREIVLTVEKPRMLDRFARRIAGEHAARHRHMDEIVTRGGGPILLERIHDHLTAYLGTRPDCRIVPTDGLSPEQTYAEVIRLR